jgi:hypothetical protein
MLDSASVVTMQRQHATADPALPGMSYAFFNQQQRGHRVLAHGGNVPGINSLLFLVPDAQLGVYFVANGGRTAFGAALRDTILAMFVPGSLTAATTVRALGERYVASLAGPYQIARYAHRTIESFPSLFATSLSIGARGGRIVLPYANGAAEFAPTDSLHFREVGGERLIAFRRGANGRVAQLVAPIPFFGAEIPAVLERRPWYEGAHFINEYISWLLLGPLILLVGLWPLAAGGASWLRRRRHRPADFGSLTGRRIALGSALAFNGLWAGFGFLVIAKSARMFERADGIVYGLTPFFRVAAIVPWILSVLAIVMSVASIRAWPRRLWDPTRRVLYGLVTFGGLLVIAFLIRWNYLPMRF